MAIDRSGNDPALPDDPGALSAEPESAALPRVSVVVAVRNEEHHLERCLESIMAQDYPGELVEVIAVDGGSSDRTPQILERYARRKDRFHRLDGHQRGVSANLNLALDQATGEVVVRVDAHTEIAPDYVRQCVETLRATGADNAGGPMRPVGSSALGEAVSRAMQTRFGVGTARFRFARRTTDVDTVYLGAFRRAVFDRVGRFDESLLRNQDYEMNYRIRRAGGRVVVNPSIRSRYHTRSTLGALGRQYFSYGFWKWRMLRRNPGSLRLRQVVAPLFVLALAAGAVATLGAAGGLGPRELVWTLPGLIAVYAAVNLAFSATLALRFGRRLVIHLPLVFATIHCAWGAGFLCSLCGLGRARS